MSHFEPITNPMFNFFFTQSSGVAVDEECKNVYDKIKKSKSHRYVVFFIKDEKSIAVEKVGDRDASYDSFLTDLMQGGESECRYGLYDMEYEHQCQGTTEVSHKQKLFLMAWCPDTARIKKKMLYSSSFDALKKSLVGVHKYVQVSIKRFSRYVVLVKLNITYNYFTLMINRHYNLVGNRCIRSQ